MKYSAKELYDLFREMQSIHFDGSNLATWESLGLKHRGFWQDFALAISDGAKVIDAW